MKPPFNQGGKMSSKIHKLTTPSKGKYHHYIAASDWHDKNMNKSTFKVMMSHAMDLPKSSRRLIIVGDFIDGAHLMIKDPLFSKWLKRGHDGLEHYFMPQAQDEFNWANDILDKLQQVFPEIWYLEGNHDWRYDWFSNICDPAYKLNFQVPIQLELASRGIEFIRYNDWLDVGDNLSITHGMYHGSTHLKKHYETCGKSVLYGHVHHADCKSFITRGKTKKAWSLPAMCDLNPDYIKNSDNNWSNGYAQFTMDSRSMFNMHILETWEGRLILPCGKVYK